MITLLTWQQGGNLQKHYSLLYDGWTPDQINNGQTMNQSWMKLLSIIRGRSQGSKILYEAKLVAGEDPLGEQLKRPDVGFTKNCLRS